MKERENNIEKKIKGLKKSNPFKVPEGYFDEFASRVQDRIHEQQKSTFWEKISDFLKPQLALATVFATASLLIFIAIQVFVDNEPSEDHEQYSEMYEIYMNELSEEQIMEMIYASEANPQVTEEAYEEVVIDYLLNEGVEITELYKEF